MSEIVFRRRFRRKMEEHSIVTFPVESHDTCPGIPDIHYQCGFFSGWVELKEIESIKNKIPYRPHQAEWLQDYSDRGGLAFTVVHIKSTSSILVIPGNLSKQAKRNINLILGLCRHYNDDEKGWLEIAGLFCQLRHFPATKEQS